MIPAISPHLGRVPGRDREHSPAPLLPHWPAAPPLGPPLRAPAQPSREDPGTRLPGLQCPPGPESAGPASGRPRLVGPAASGRRWLATPEMGKVRGLRTRVHQAAVRPAGAAAPLPAPPLQEAAPPQTSAGGVGGKVNEGSRAVLGGWGECTWLGGGGGGGGATPPGAASGVLVGSRALLWAARGGANPLATRDRVLARSAGRLSQRGVVAPGSAHVATAAEGLACTAPLAGREEA